MLEWLSANKPESYMFLLRELASTAPNGLSTYNFLVYFVALCDCALFGQLIPGVPGYGEAGLKWKDIHPAWRMCQLLTLLQNNNDARR